MNKPYQFRVYDEKYRYWDNTPLVIYPNTPIVKQGRVIQWYSGLNDKNGVPIYEGDIVLFGDQKYVIEYYDKWEARCPYVFVYKRNPRIEEFRHVSSSKVVGNIFDTPELLRG